MHTTKMRTAKTRAAEWMIGELVGLVLVLGCGCASERAGPVASDQASGDSVQLRLRFVYEGTDPGKQAAAGKILGFPDPGDAYWDTHDPDDWSAWPAHVQQAMGFDIGPEVDQALEVQGAQAKGTLRVKAGEKFLLVGCFEQGLLKYTGTSDVTAQPGEPNAATITMSPWAEASYAVDEVRVLVYHVRDLVGETEGRAELTVDLPGGATMDLIWIDPGTFTMGAPSDELGRYDQEGPQHAVTISAGFYLGKYELTQGQWESVLGTTPWSGQGYVQEDAFSPAVYISWDDVQLLLAALNGGGGGGRYRLPTEAEWEYACRAGTETGWSFGDAEADLGDYAWYDADAGNVGEGYAHRVGMKLPNPWGFHDMHGNVFEWVQDWYGSYSSDVQTDPSGPTSGSYRVIRGGGFVYYARTARSAYRGFYSPGDRSYGFGVRLLRTD